VRKKIIITLLIICSAGTIFVLIVINNILPYAGIMPRRLIVQTPVEQLKNNILFKDYNLLAKPLQVKTSDAILLKGYFVYATVDTSNTTIILLHGIGNCKENQLGRAQMLADAGFNSVILDLRAHGESGGKYCTFGYYEKEDVKLFVNEIFKINKNSVVGIWGKSLGGAIALQTMAMDDRIGFGIIESTFDEFNKVALEYGADYLLGYKIKWLTNYVLNKSGAIAHFNPNDIKPVVAAKSTTKPVLFIHGDADHKIPIEFNRNNYNAVKNSAKVWITVPGAGHHDVGAVGGDALNDAILKFVARRSR
jgi:pimeloyl-ACP methyl ester carboxylesterase